MTLTWLTSYLSVMKNDLDNILTKSHKSFGKRTLHKDALNRLIVDYVQRMNNLRLNFLVQLSIIQCACYLREFQVQLSLDTRRVIATASHSEGKDRGIFDDLDTSDVGIPAAPVNMRLDLFPPVLQIQTCRYPFDRDSCNRRSESP